MITYGSTTLTSYNSIIKTVDYFTHIENDNILNRAASRVIISLPLFQNGRRCLLMSTYDILMLIFSGICASGTIFTVVDTLKRTMKRNIRKMRK